MSCNSARKPIWSESLSVHLFFICCCWSYISLLGTIRILSDGSEVFKLKSQQVAGGGRLTGWICDSSPGLVMCRLCASFRYSSNKRNISSDWSGCLPVLSLSVLIIARLSASLHFIYLLMVKYWWHSPPFLFLLWRTLSSSSPRNKLRRWWKGFSVCDCFLFFWNLAGVSNVVEEVCSEEEMQLRLQWPTVLTESVSYHI